MTKLDKDFEHRSYFSENEILVQPHGGIGNQLFMYFGGLYLAKKLGMKLCVNLPLDHKSFENHNGTIADFNLDARIEYGHRLVGQRALDKFYSGLIESPHAPMNIKKILGKNIQHYRGVGSGFSSSLDLLSSPRIVSGYFQTWRYWSALPAANQNIWEVNSEKSREFSMYEEEIKSQESLVVHIRRGDYLKKSKDFGVLAPSYYKNAINYFIGLGVKPKVFFFSDDPDFVKSNICPLVPDSWTLVDPNKRIPPTQTLKLMSFGDYFITGNSTFSWWAAVLSRREPSNVVAPTKWFQNLHEPVDLRPNGWVGKESEWTD